MCLQRPNRRKIIITFSASFTILLVRLGAIVLLLAFLFISCAGKAPPPRPSGYPKPYRVGKTWYQPIPHARDFRQKGKASWYGADFHGRRTSNGEIYDMHAATAAHKTLPFNTYVRVINLDNNRSTRVRINDRGPFVRGRIIDLSKTAAAEIGMLGPGTANVEIVALGAISERVADGKVVRTYTPQDYYTGQFTFQVGAFKNRDNAERLRHRLNEKYINAHISVFESESGTFFRVRVGLCTDLEQAEGYEKTLIQDGFPEAFIVAE